MKMVCSHCGQPLPVKRLGVRLTPFKARIFDIVKRAGPDGIMASDLYDMLYTDGESRHSLRSHIWQINTMIYDEGYRIEGVGSKRYSSCYVLKRV